ncbi:MAG TPA: DUF4445 domain-containing protein [Candidatus Gallacutalibacter stercoravium]|nr:DUF4445 domain-containing protein [Candidatus Gallacutalibacter stercoravium]
MTTMAVLTVHTGGKTEHIQFDGEVLLADLLHGHPGLVMPCGGRHTCGKCRVKAAGGLVPAEEQELKLLGAQAAGQGIRLACFARAIEDCEVWLQAGEDDSAVQAGFLGAVFTPDEKPGWGFAVDIGTTTVVVYLYRLGQAQPVGTIGRMNGQRRFGADVISRIEACNQQGQPGRDEMQRSIVGQLNEMFAQALQEHTVPASEVKRVVITGNTTMLHFLMGYDAAGIAVSPFTPQSLFGEETAAGGLFPALQNASLFLPRCVGAYMGADVMCAVLASGMTKKEQCSLLVDVGTNGEMALWRQGKLITCSTAAGPAFEGAEITMGMTASRGAVNDVRLQDGKIVCTTIGDEPAKGICGTGIISAIALLLDLGIIGDSGLIEQEDHDFTDLIGESDEWGVFVRLGDSGVVLTQQDVRNIQLAKAAICAGLLTLAHEAGIPMEEVQALYLCGGFGSYIDAVKAAHIGLIPAALQQKAVAMGNGAGMGAGMALLSDQMREACTALALEARDIPLSASPYFMDQYIECMMFPEQE